MLQEVRKESLLKKVSWTIVIVLSLSGLGYYVKESYVKYRISPEVLVNERSIQRNEIPFPAVTICPPTVARFEMINASKVIHEILLNITPSLEEQQILASLGQSCITYQLELNKIPGNKSYVENVVDTLNKSALHINETLKKCISGEDENTDCDTKFTRSLTTFGYCFTFNMLDHHSIFTDEISKDFDSFKHKISKGDTVKWTLEKGYLTDEKLVEPFKSTEVEYFSLHTMIRKIESANFCRMLQGNFRLVFHMPNEIPSDMNLFSYFALNQTTVMRISAKVKSLDVSMRDYPILLRKCYFEGEKQLRFFKIYTLSNCIHECITNFTLKKCGCAFFGSPRSADMKVCTFKEIKCINHIHWKWPSSYYEDAENVEKFKEFPCNCMPTCTDIEYTYIQNILEWDQMNTDEMFVGRLYMKFSHRNIIETTSYVTYRLQNFICDIGGLVGLFLGFSLLTLFKFLLQVFDFCLAFISRVFRKFSRAMMRTFHQLRRRVYPDQRPSHDPGQRIVFIVPFEDYEIASENELRC